MKEFGSFKGIKSIEIGGGEAYDSLLFAMEGADVTILDHSTNALKTTKKLFDRFGYKANYIQANALEIDKKYFEKFDVAMSFGMAEHFTGKKNRIQVFKSHFDVLKKGGFVWISVPNSWNLPYRLWKFLSVTFRRFQFGQEIPYSIFEIKRIGKELNKDFEIIGGNLFFTHFQFKRRIRKFLGMPEKDFDKSKLKQEIATPLDKYFGFEIVAFGKKF
jgi:ubiquinone/menaquinone biosynthesis C-methylase UbiE